MQHNAALTSVKDLIGNTPLVRLQNLFAEHHFQVFAKLELCNPGGSMKDRPALSMIEHAIAEGLIGPGSTIIESSSGNMGIALAQICSQYKLPFICIVDTRTNLVNINIMKAYGATIELAKPPDGGDLLKARLARVNELLASIPNSYWPNQYANPYNPISHEKTMQEIDTALAGKVDYLFAPISTCGTIRGCSDYIKKKKMKTKIYAVDAFGSIIFGGKPAPRLLPGHGASIRSALFRPNMADDVVYVRDEECVQGCRELLKKETIFAGGSSGGVVSALQKTADVIAQNANVVIILADRGERYLDTVYNDSWVTNQLSHSGKHHEIK